MCLIFVDHGLGVTSVFMHLETLVVTVGDKVSQGDIIGTVGSTGRSTGPHLHYEVRVDGQAVNPVPYMVESEAQRAFALATGTGGQGDGDDN